MDLPNECMYDILVFLEPKELLLCCQINTNFNNLCKLESLWKLFVDDKYKKLYEEKTYYEVAKIYYPLYQFLIVREKDLYFLYWPFSDFDGTKYDTSERVSLAEPHISSSFQLMILFKNRNDIDLYNRLLRTMKNIEKSDQIVVSYKEPRFIKKIKSKPKNEFKELIDSTTKKNVEIENEFTNLIEKLKKLGCCNCEVIESPIYEKYRDEWYEWTNWYGMMNAHISIGTHY